MCPWTSTFLSPCHLLCRFMPEPTALELVRGLKEMVPVKHLQPCARHTGRKCRVNCVCVSLTPPEKHIVSATADTHTCTRVRVHISFLLPGRKGVHRSFIGHVKLFCGGQHAFHPPQQNHFTWERAWEGAPVPSFLGQAPSKRPTQRLHACPWCPDRRAWPVRAACFPCIPGSRLIG